MLAWLDRTVEHASRLVPDAVWHVDHWMLMRWPLLWRSRLVPILCLTVPLTVASAAIGLRHDMSTQTVWTEGELRYVVDVFALAMVTLAGVWARVQGQYPLGERPLRDYVVAAMCSFVALLTFLAPPAALYGGLSMRIAEVMTPAALHEELEYHTRHGFWCCTRAFTLAEAQAEGAKLDAKLAMFGLKSEGRLYTGSMSGFVTPVACDLSGLICLDVRDKGGALRPFLLRDRLIAIQSHQSMAQGDVPHFAVASGSHLKRWLVALLAAAVAVVMLGIRRRAVSTTLSDLAARVRSAGGGIAVSRPAWFRRFDERALLNSPSVWATRVHVFLPLSFASAVALSLLLAYVAGGNADAREMGMLVMSCLVALTTGYWLFMSRRHLIPATTAKAVRRVTGLYLLALVPAPVACALSLGFAEDLFVWLLGFASMLALAGVYAHLVDVRSAVWGTIAAVFSLLFAVALLFFGQVTFLVLVLAWPVLAWLLPRRARGNLHKARRRRLAVNAIVFTAPCITLVLTAVLVAVAASLLPGALKGALEVAALPLAIALTLGVFLPSSLAVLARLRFQPRRE
ncbi:MAG TPA: hypothetical protein VHP37_26475 [Burkholderiales bacterium]|nr:hypothetical protein [Burkholderiales bacterium]